jgi:hypothetical protein
MIDIRLKRNPLLLSSSPFEILVTIMDLTKDHGNRPTSWTCLAGNNVTMGEIDYLLSLYDRETVRTTE